MGEEYLDAHRGVDVVDFSSPVQGVGGVMYPLLHWRVEDAGVDFVMDIDDEELVVASDVTLLSGGKGGVLWMICVVLLLDLFFIHLLIKMIGRGGFGVVEFLVAAVGLSSIPLCIWMFKSIKYKSRIEPVLFNSVDQTVTHYGEDRVRTFAWDKLRPFIRIVRVVGTAGGAQVELLVLADLDEVSGRVRAEIVAGRGDVIAAGALRYGFFKAYMDGPREDLPGFHLISVNPDWMQRIALSLWMVPALRWRWLGEKPWSPWIGVASIFNTVAALPLLIPELIAARITLGPRGESSLGPWHKRFNALAPDSTLHKLARHHGDVVVQARRCLLAAMVIGCVFWLAVGVFFGLVLTS
jgi:hypothetical protein